MIQKYILSLIMFGIILISGCIQDNQNMNDVSVSDLINNPQSYDGEIIMLSGVVVKNTGNFFGSTYQLAVFENSKSFDINNAKKIAFKQQNSYMFNMSMVVSYTYDGRTYTEKEYKIFTFRGTIHYIGEVIDDSSFYFEAEAVMDNV
ncbi:hypothetical protein GQ473_05485 [archaeon]|nr:hypothetical protein [archaeon]